MFDDKIDRLNYGLAFFEEASKPYKHLHFHNEIEMGILKSGRVSAIFSGKVLHVNPGDLVVFWAAQPHGPMESLDQPVTYNLCIPLPLFLGWKLPAAFQHHLLTGTVLKYTLHNPENTIASFSDWRDLLQSRDAEQANIALLEIQAFLLRLALKQPEKDEPVEDLHLYQANYRHFQRMTAFIAEHHRENISIDDIATVAGLHPKYAMRVFKQISGSTILQYLTHQRISSAQHLLIASDQSALDIAFAAGFSSASRFYSSFAAINGCSPGKYRKLNRKAG
ncbi:MAG: helix-turn-helix domain-containing protein [Kiritimatiellales bacterium]|nr:helix-turn-helix domain-containing protein [Kiritimatiellales bacterium]MCF7864484.1 helix-turn-helix domain-containing protein [Kiritimatiellales bacterium]